MYILKCDDLRDGVVFTKGHVLAPYVQNGVDHTDGL